MSFLRKQESTISPRLLPARILCEVKKMANHDNQNDFQNLPPSAAVFIGRIIKKMRYRKKVGQDVQTELVAHFEDGLKDCTTDEDKEQTALRLIADFGDIKLLALLLRRAKKRCRPFWRTTVARTLQTLGILLLSFILYAVWFSTGKPVITVDYTALLNKMNRPELRDEDNAWPSYKQASSLFIEPDDPNFKKLAFSATNSSEHRKFADLAENEKQKIAEWVQLNQPAWREFENAAARSYNSTSPPGGNLKMPPPGHIATENTPTTRTTRKNGSCQSSSPTSAISEISPE